MRLQYALLPAISLLLGESAAAGSLVLDSSVLRFRSASRNHLRRDADRAISAALHPRLAEPQNIAAPTQSASPAGSISSSSASDPNFDIVAFNDTATAACMSTLATITNVDNPTGMAGCYNIPFLNTSTGVFQADLRLYQISAPSGEFSQAKSSDFSVALSYPDATIQDISGKVLPNGTANGGSTAPSRKRQGQGAATTPSLVELQQFWFIGQVDKPLTLTKLSSTDLMALLIPAISLSAPSSSDPAQTTSTNLTSASVIYFAAGLFAGQTASGAAAALPSAALAAKQKASAFVLPGTTMGIFPVGLVITGSWALCFVVAVGWGTWGRMAFRDHYRARVMHAEKRTGKGW